MTRQRIIMNFTHPPSIDDVDAILQGIVDSLPDELDPYCNNLVLVVEDFPDESFVTDLELESEYDILVHYYDGRTLSPGVQKKVSDEDDRLMVFRRPLLDYWCETEEDLNMLLRRLVIEELGRVFSFSESEIDEMSSRHHQGLLYA